MLAPSFVNGICCGQGNLGRKRRIVSFRRLTASALALNAGLWGMVRALPCGDLGEGDGERAREQVSPQDIAESNARSRSSLLLLLIIIIINSLVLTLTSLVSRLDQLLATLPCDLIVCKTRGAP